MKNKLYSILVGAVTTLMVALLSWHYLRYQKSHQSTAQISNMMQVIETMDHRFNDLKFKFMKKKSTTAPVVLVSVDEESLREIGRWPWGRDTVADLTEKLFSYGVKTVGMDVIQAEPDLRYPEHDQKMGELVEKYKDKIVLGTYSEDRLVVDPYKDYCVNEAFLLNGGAQIVKFNATFVVDDMSENFEDLKWGRLFRGIFKAVQSKSEQDYLDQLNKKSLTELTAFQKNYLKAKKVRDVFEYCQSWLTEQDSVYFQNMEVLKAQYDELFSKKKDFEKLSVEKKIEKFKKSVIEFPTPQYGEWQGNIPVIQEPSSYTASFVAHLDLDGYVRRYPLFYRSGNKLGTSFVPSLALQTYLVAQGYRADVKVEVVDQQKQITSFQIINPQTDPETVVHDLPVDTLGRLIVNYYGPSFTLPSVSAKDLFSDDEKIAVITHEASHGQEQVRLKIEHVDKKEFFKNKMAVLGVTAVGLYDLRNTPVAANYPGPEIHLTMMANLFEGKFLRHFNKEATILPLSILVLGICLSFLLSWAGALGSVVSFSTALALHFFVDRYLFEKHQIMYSSFFILLEITTLHFTVFMYKYFSEERKKNALKKTFSKYVSPAVVDELLKNEENLKLGGKKQELSVFFSDVRGFTEFSERMDPEELSKFLNEYLTPMTELVFNNKGTLDKYMGDGLMAFFGAPVPFEDHAYAACKCALQSLEELKILQDTFEKRGWPKIDIGIGINTGTMSVGNMGSKIVQSYTVIGDAVNLASRLEGTTKEYGARILVSEFTYEKVKSRFVFREVDRVRVKGKKEPVRAYELLSEVSSNDSVIWLERYREAYQVYHRKDFKTAHEMFLKLEQLYPKDKLIQVYRDRCRDFLAAPPDSTWDGVYDRRTK
jgi:adenylate cyclase